MLSLRVSLTGPNTVRALPPSHTPSFLRSGDATVEGRPVAAFGWTTLTGSVPPLHAKPPLVAGYDDEAVPHQ